MRHKRSNDLSGSLVSHEGKRLPQIGTFAQNRSLKAVGGVFTEHAMNPKAATLIEPDPAAEKE